MTSFVPPVDSTPACIRHLPVSGAPRHLLVAVPHAGGAASGFRSWAPRLPAGVALVAVQPPGRETRSHEPPSTDMATLVGELCVALSGLPRLPLTLFGHSFGGHMAFETCRRLASGSGPEVTRLVVSGARAPHLPSGVVPISHLADAEFLAALIDLGGVPRELFAHRDYLQAILPMVRADLLMAEQYRADAGPPLRCPISVFGGHDDPLAPARSLDGWREHTVAGTSRTTFPGDHFFVVQHRDLVLAVLGGLLGQGGGAAEAQP